MGWAERLRTPRLSGRTEDVEHMERVQQDVLTVLRKYQANTEAAILVFALVRLVRSLIGLYPKRSTQVELRHACTTFLQSGPTDRDDPAARLILPN